MRIFKILTLCATLVVLSAFAVNVAVEGDKTGYTVGDKATDFYLRNVDGQMMSMMDYRDAKGFIVSFTCNTCPFSEVNHKRLNALNKKYKSLGYPVIAINPNDPLLKPGDSFKAMQERAIRKGLNFPYLEDNHQEVFLKYGATKTPQTFLLQKNAHKDLIVRYIGAVDNGTRNPKAVTEHYLEDAIVALLEGREIENRNTKTQGCSIKY